jgi:transposase
MYIDIVPNRASPPAILLRQSVRDGDKVRKETLANLSHLPLESARAIQAVLRGEPLRSGSESIEKVRDRALGAVQAVRTTMRRLALDRLLAARASQERSLVLGMVAARILMPGSKLATARSWGTTTLPEELGIQKATEDDLYRAMDWLLGRQEAIENALAARHLRDGAMVLYDLSSSYFEGEGCPLAKRGYSRDGAPGTLQVNYGLLTDDVGRPISVSVFPGNTTDSTTVMEQARKVKERFKVQDMVLVGDRGMITKKQIGELATLEGLDWITALKSADIASLIDDKTIQMDLFDKATFSEITHADYPGERLVACFNEDLKKRRAHKRAELIAATRVLLDKVVQRVVSQAGGKYKLDTPDKIGVAVGKIIAKHKVGKHFKYIIGDKKFEYAVDQEKIDHEARVDGIYVIRTSLTAEQRLAADAVRDYKRLTRVERAFRCFKMVDLKVRPIHHFAEPRVRSHILLCMLAYYVEWHMYQAWQNLLFCDSELDVNRPVRDPVAPAEPSASARAKAKTKRTPDGRPVHSFSSLLRDLGTITRSTCRVPGSSQGSSTFELDTLPSPLQREALALVEAITMYPVE